jgi:hypothetical protein
MQFNGCQKSFVAMNTVRTGAMMIPLNHSIPEVRRFYTAFHGA